MDLNLKTFTLGEVRTVLDTTVDNPFDFDVNLPDYFPDIQRVLKCTVTPGITASNSVAGKAVAEGNALMRIIYSADDKKIYCYEQSFSFSKNVEDSDLTGNDSLITTVKTDYVNCRATGQRKLSLSGVISIRFTVKSRMERRFVCGCENEDIQLQSKRIDAVSTVNCCTKSFAMSEVAQLAGNEPIDKIINSSAFIVVDSTKAVSGKILIKGNLVTNIVYRPESDAVESTVFSHTMPVSQIIEVNGVNEDSINDLCVKVGELNVTPKTDAGGKKNQVEISVKIDTFIVSDTRIETDVVNDAYSLSGDLCGKYENIELKKIVDKVSDTVTTTKTFEMNSDGVTSVIAVWSNDVRYSHRVKGNELIVSGSVSVVMLLTNRDNEPYPVEKDIEFEYTKRLTSEIDSVSFDPTVQISVCRGSIDSTDSVTVRAEIEIAGTVCAFTDKRVLTDASVEDLSDDRADIPPIMIYFAQQGEDLWSIARKYRTTAESIKIENDLTDDIFNEKRMIVIPSVN